MNEEITYILYIATAEGQELALNKIQYNGCSEWYREECEQSMPQNTLRGSQIMFGIAEIAI